MRAGALIFDFNGVIADDESLHRQAIRRVLEDVGVAFDPEVYRILVPGRLPSEAFELLLRDAGVEADVGECVRTKERYYEEALGGEVPTFPGVRQLLGELFDRGFTLAVASTARRRSIEATLERLSARGLFSAIVSAEDVTRGKPDPEIYRLAASRLALEPGRCVVIEDSVNGVRAAKAAGMACIAVTHTVPGSCLEDADLVLDHEELTNPGAFLAKLQEVDPRC